LRQQRSCAETGEGDLKIDASGFQGRDGRHLPDAQGQDDNRPAGQEGNGLNVLFVTAELYSLAKEGGLADVSASLPRALQKRGIDVRIVMPAYPQALDRARSLRKVLSLANPVGFGETRLLETHLPGSDVPVLLVDCPSLYGRKGGLYRDGNGCDWADNDVRFALLSHVSAAIARGLVAQWRPDIVHANDWHTGLLPALLSECDRLRTATVFTIHNLAYQGCFAKDRFEGLRLPESSKSALEFYGKISFLKAGIDLADAITTVSPTYAKEIMTVECGCGLDETLRERAACVRGILNGVDYAIWDPGADQHIVRNYSEQTAALKAVNKRVLQSEMGLDVDAEKPLLAFASRLVHQKMPDAVLETLPLLVEDGMQFALVAEGERDYQNRFRALADDYPGRVAVRIGYEERQAHRLMAGADILLHPSRFEPCGLVPIYALRYGTIPVVRSSGGMADTVIDATASALQRGTATGFSFEPPNATQLLRAVRRAHTLYRQPTIWHRLRQSAMRQDFSWGRSAQAYVDTYYALTNARRTATFEPRGDERVKLLA
jgi:starch synthase